eukprot:5316892-Karenia_brevis.AAC.1
MDLMFVDVGTSTESRAAAKGVASEKKNLLAKPEKLRLAEMRIEDGKASKLNLLKSESRSDES